VPSMVLRGPDRDSLIRPIVDTRTANRFVPTGNEEEDVRVLTRLIMQSLETQIRAHPEQWYIFRRVWPQIDMLAASAAAGVEAR
jgi:lauroyl/myristoyl acyltransferase